MREKAKRVLGRYFTYKVSFADLFFLLLLTVVFFSLPVFLAPDSVAYVDNAHVLAGSAPASAWNSLRGPVLPFLLRLGFAFFGESAFGLTVLFYLEYLVLVLLALYACHLLGLFARLGKVLTWVLCSAVLLLNPTVLCYAHFVLTEFSALVLGMLAFCLVLKTHQLLMDGIGKQKGARKVAVWLARYLGVALCVVLLYALKQMFFALAVVLFLLSEIMLLCLRFSLRQVAASVLALVLLAASIPLWAAVWEGGSAQESSGAVTTQSLTQNALIDGPRYFRPAERGVVGRPVRIDVMSDGYAEVLDSFEYTFSGTFAGSLHYLATCFSRAPGRFVTSWVHNYLVIANVRQVLTYSIHRAYEPVSITNHFFRAFETEAWMEHFAFMGRYEEAGAAPYKAPLPQFEQALDAGLVSNLLYNTHFKSFAYFIYSFTAFVAPFVTLFAFVMCLVRRKKDEKSAFWQHVTLLAGGVFGTIFFLAVTASNIDRYGFPVTGFAALLFMLCVVTAVQYGWKTLAPPAKRWVARLKTQKGQKKSLPKE